MTIDEAIGANVHELVWRRRLQQKPVYEAMGLSRGSFAKKLRGEVVWNARDIAAVAGVLGVDPGELFEGVLPHLDSNQKPAGYRMSTGNRCGYQTDRGRLVDRAYSRARWTVVA